VEGRQQIYAPLQPRGQLAVPDFLPLQAFAGSAMEKMFHELGLQGQRPATMRMDPDGLRRS